MIRGWIEGVMMAKSTELVSDTRSNELNNDIELVSLLKNTKGRKIKSCKKASKLTGSNWNVEKADIKMRGRKPNMKCDRREEEEVKTGEDLVNLDASTLDSYEDESTIGSSEVYQMDQNQISSSFESSRSQEMDLIPSSSRTVGINHTNSTPNKKPQKPRRRVATLAQRRAANIRERRRMFNLNSAFDRLRKKVPSFAYEKRLSRIETLKLAIMYIRFMDNLVNDDAYVEKYKQLVANSSTLSSSSGSTMGANYLTSFNTPYRSLYGDCNESSDDAGQPELRLKFEAAPPEYIATSRCQDIASNQVQCQQLADIGGAIYSSNRGRKSNQTESCSAACDQRAILNGGQFEGCKSTSSNTDARNFSSNRPIQSNSQQPIQVNQFHHCADTAHNSCSPALYRSPTIHTNSSTTISPSTALCCSSPTSTTTMTTQNACHPPVFAVATSDSINNSSPHPTSPQTSSPTLTSMNSTGFYRPNAYPNSCPVGQPYGLKLAQPSLPTVRHKEMYYTGSSSGNGVNGELNGAQSSVEVRSIEGPRVDRDQANHELLQCYAPPLAHRAPIQPQFNSPPQQNNPNQQMTIAYPNSPYPQQSSAMINSNAAGYRQHSMQTLEAR